MKSFEQIVSDSYENGDFELPEVTHYGDIHPEDLHFSGVTIIQRELGDASISEALSAYTKNTKVNNEITYIQNPDGSGSVHNTNNPQYTRVWGPDGIIHTRTESDS